MAVVKPVVRQIEDESGVLIVDDTIQEKPYTDENALIIWHFDHSKGHTVKGVTILNSLYHAQSLSIPVAFEIVHKDCLYCELKTHKVRRKSEVTKNELMRAMLRTCQHNALLYRYVLSDNWFSTAENMNYITRSCTWSSSWQLNPIALWQ